METKKTNQIVEVVFVFLVLLSAETILANDPNWPQFRGPNASGHAAKGQNPPIQFGPEQNLLWKTSVPRGHSSPCIWGDNVFLTGFDEEKQELRVFCLDRISGKIRWSRIVPAEQIEKVGDICSPAQPTPAADGERIYVHFGSYGLLCYDFDGNLQWTVPLPIPPGQRFGVGCSPIVVGECVILIRRDPDERYLLAVNRCTGKTVWKHVSQRYPWKFSTPVVWNGQLITHWVNEIVANSVTDGTRIWSVSIATAGTSSPVIGDNVLFVAACKPGTHGGEPFQLPEPPDFKTIIEEYDKDGDLKLSRTELPADLEIDNRPEIADIEEAKESVRGYFGRLDGNKDGLIDETEWKGLSELGLAVSREHGLVAIKPGGEGDVTATHVLWQEKRFVSEVPSPLYHDGRVYMVKDGGIVSCMDASSGKLLYRERLRAPGLYCSSPICAGGRIYTASSKGIITVFKAGDTLEVLARNDLKEQILATPAVVDNKLYVRTDKNIYAFVKAEEDSIQTPLDIATKVEDHQAKTLYEAAAYGDVELVKSIIYSGADVNAPNSWGWTPLYFAVSNGHRDIARLLIENGADFRGADEDGVTLLHRAAEHGYRDIAALLIDKGADFRVADGDEETPLHRAAERGHMDITTLLIDKGADINAKNDSGQTPLHFASRSGRSEVTKLLMAKGADFKAQNSNGRTAAGLAKENGHTEIVELLRKHANQSGTTEEIMTIHDYAAVGDMEQIELLVSKGMDVNAKTQRGGTALHWAAYQGRRDVAECLISNGAGINTKDNNGFTPLHVAARSGQKDMVESLIAKGADINATNNRGVTPLVLARRRGHTEIVKLLRKHREKE